MKNQINIGLIGYGVVGSGTAQLLKEHKREAEDRVGTKINLSWVCSRHKKNSPYIDSSTKQTTDWKDVIADPEVDCVVELMGGTSPAIDVVLSALEAGKHVVTANKAILSKHWNDIFGLANRNRRLVYFEAAVGGGVPVVQALNEGLAGNRIRKIIGILNGTTNFMLTKMHEEGVSYGDALRAAKKAGFAEGNPKFDVEGIDAAQKISILGSLAAGSWISPDHVWTEGISKLNPLDIKLAHEHLHSVIKLLGIAEKTTKGWSLRVHPTLIPNSHPFANVRNEYNAISLYGNAVGDVMLYGKGAGRMPTSSAVMSDIIFICRHIANGTAGRLPYVTRRQEDQTAQVNIDHVHGRYYLRINTVDKPGVLARITRILGKNGVSIASVHQDSIENLIPGNSRRRGVPIILITHDNLEASVQASVEAINKLKTTRSKTVLLRMQ